MRQAWRYLVVCVVVSAMAMMSAGVRAQGTNNAATAQALYEEAMKLMDSGKYAEACPKLAESYRIEPAMGTQFRLAECYEKNGQVASAWSTFNAVAAAARQAGNATREQTALRRAEAIAPRVPTLTIVVPPQAAAIAGFELKRNGVVVPPSDWNRALSVDPGEYRVTVAGPGIRPLEHKVMVTESTMKTITVAGL